MLEIGQLFLSWILSAHNTSLLTFLSLVFCFSQRPTLRPDILPPLVLKELQRLCDKVEPVEFDTAMNTVREELGEDWNENVEELELVTSASLGQVYKVLMRSGEVFAMKVQRPDMTRRVH